MGLNVDIAGRGKGSMQIYSQGILFPFRLHLEKHISCVRTWTLLFHKWFHSQPLLLQPKLALIK